MLPKDSALLVLERLATEQQRVDDFKPGILVKYAKDSLSNHLLFTRQGVPYINDLFTP